MRKLELLSRIFTIGEYVQLFTSSLHEQGFYLPSMYQDMLRNLAIKNGQLMILETYWKERTKEYIALEGSKYSVGNGIYPESPIYKSRFINIMREKYNSGDQQYPIPEPTHIFFETNSEAFKLKSELHERILDRRQIELSSLEVADISNFIEMPLSQQREAIFALFVDIFSKQGFVKDAIRYKENVPSVRFVTEDIEWDICCYMAYDYKTRLYPPELGLFLIKKNCKVDLWRRNFNSEHCVQIKTVDLCPGFDYYTWQCERYLDFALAFKAYHRLFLVVSKTIVGRIQLRSATL
jgi:hypothetical protein